MKCMTHNNLFTSNSKTSKIIFRLISILVCIGLFFGTIKVLNFMYVQNYSWERNNWHYFYTEEKNIDNLFVGSSHVYTGVNPFILDELNGDNNFNLAMASMRMNGCYYSILEATKRNKVKNIYLELYYGVTVGENCGLDSWSTLYTNWKSTDNMRFSWNKLKYQLSMSSRDKYVETFFPFVRYRENLFDIGYIYGNIAEKRTEDYRNYRFSETNEYGYTEHAGKGYLYADATLVESGLLYNRSEALAQDELMTKGVEECLEKIIDYCKEQGIKLTLFIAPVHGLHTEASGDYDAYYSRVSEIAGANGIDFYDFNLCKQEYFDTTDMPLFMDLGHLNHVGAEKYTKLLWDVVSGNIEKEKCFYQSYAEKRADETPRIYGMYWSEKEDGLRQYTIASNRDAGLEYRIVYIEGEEQEVIQDYSDNKSFLLDSDRHGTVRIELRDSENDNLQSLCISI